MDPDGPLPEWVADMEGRNLSAENIGKHVTVLIFPACVARPVRKGELEATPKAIAARQKEWKNLADKKTGNFKSVRGVTLVPFSFIAGIGLLIFLQINALVIHLKSF